nr:MAG: VP11 [Eriocheir sinensis reovirus 1]
MDAQDAILSSGSSASLVNTLKNLVLDCLVTVRNGRSHMVISPPNRAIMFDSWAIIEMGNYSIDVSNATDVAFMSMLMRFVATGVKSGASFDLVAQYISIYERMRLVDLSVLDARLLINLAAEQQTDRAVRAFVVLYEVYKIQGKTADLKPHVMRSIQAFVNIFNRLENGQTVECPSYSFTSGKMRSEYMPRLSNFIEQTRINNNWDKARRLRMLRPNNLMVNNTPNMMKAYESCMNRRIVYKTAATFIDMRPAVARVWR